MHVKTLLAIRAASDETLAAIALRFSERYPEEFEELLGCDRQQITVTYPETRDGSVIVELSGDVVERIKVAGNAGKISAIKAARSLLPNLGLLEAKLLVEQQGWYRALGSSNT